MYTWVMVTFWEIKKQFLKNVIKREYNPFSGENKNKYNTFDREKNRKKIYKANFFKAK